MDNVKELKLVKFTYSEFKDIIYIKLLNGDIIWEQLFVEDNHKKEERCLMKFANDLEFRLDLPRTHFFRFLKSIDVKKNGFLSYGNWISAYKAPLLQPDKYSYLLREENIEDKQQAAYVPDYNFKDEDFSFEDDD